MQDQEPKRLAKDDTNSVRLDKAILGRKRIPLDLRLALCREVLRLRKESLSYGRIISQIKERYNVTLAKGNYFGLGCRHEHPI